MSSVPSRAVLEAHLDHTVQLVGGDGRGVAVELVGVHNGAALDASYECYVAELRLPAGLWLEQGVYNLAVDEHQVWPILFVPTRPDSEGRGRMEAVFHIRGDSGSVATRRIG